MTGSTRDRDDLLAVLAADADNVDAPDQLLERARLAAGRHGRRPSYHRPRLWIGVAAAVAAVLVVALVAALLTNRAGNGSRPTAATNRTESPTGSQSRPGPNPGFASTSANGTVTYAGVGAVAAPAPADAQPKITRNRALSLVSSAPTTLGGPPRLVSLRLVEYENAFTKNVNGLQVPEVPRQLAWLVERSAQSVGPPPGGPISARTRSPAATTNWTCYSWVAISASNGSVLDSFDACGPNTGH